MASLAFRISLGSILKFSVGFGVSLASNPEEKKGEERGKQRTAPIMMGHLDKSLYMNLG
jgi:hypothetical protein